MASEDTEKHQAKAINVDKSDPPADDLPSSNYGVRGSQKLSEMQQQVGQLCTDLTATTEKFDPQKWSEKFKVYIEKYKRLLYSTVSNYIFDLSDDKHTAFLTNLDGVIDYISTLPDGSPVRVSILKFYDHVNLAQRQFVIFSGKETDIESLISQKINPALSATTKELTSQLVGLVAIFTALSFIVFGGISSLSGIFSNIERQNAILPTMLFVLLWMAGMLNLIFSFMYFIIKIVRNDTDKNESMNFVQKHPLICICNGILATTILICIAILQAEKYGVWVLSHEFVEKYNSYIFWTCLVALLVFIVFIWAFISVNYNSGKSKCNMSDGNQSKR